MQYIENMTFFYKLFCVEFRAEKAGRFLFINFHRLYSDKIALESLIDKVIKMFKIKVLVLFLGLVLSACATERPSLMGVDGGAIPPAFAHFPDVPFPNDAVVDLDETKALGSGENWIGSLVYTTPYNPSNVFDFYVSEMPKLKWIEVAVVRAKISHMTYIRDHRAVQILIEMDNGDNARVTITAIPNTNGVGKI